MQEIETAFVEVINQAARQSVVLDEFIALFANNRLLKGGILTGLLYWTWFTAESQSKERNVLLITLISIPVVVVVARFLALYLPFRSRPMHDDGIDFTLPFGIAPEVLQGWSSFPSDHAVLYFALAVGILIASKRIGLLAIFYAVVIIGLPRIYAGYHYPTDILGGMAIGGLLMYASIARFSGASYLATVHAWEKANTKAFYAVFFIVTYQIANLFEESREIAWTLYRVLILTIT